MSGVATLFACPTIKSVYTVRLASHYRLIADTYSPEGDAMQRKLFRQTSLERLSSPEQLDQLLQVTTPQGWLALIGLGGLLIMALLWGVFGSVQNTKVGQGIL